jgi:hypothetical protein
MKGTIDQVVEDARSESRRGGRERDEDQKSEPQEEEQEGEGSDETDGAARGGDE